MRARRLVPILLLTAFLVPATFVHAQDAAPASPAAPAAQAGPTVVPEKDRASLDDIRKLIRAVGLEKELDQSMPGVVQGMREEMKDVPDDVWKQFVAEVDYKSLNDRIANIYVKYLTKDEVKKLIAIYESPVVQKWSRLSDETTQEMSSAGMAWAIETLKKLTDKMEKKTE